MSLLRPELVEIVVVRVDLLGRDGAVELVGRRSSWPGRDRRSGRPPGCRRSAAAAASPAADTMPRPNPLQDRCGGRGRPVPAWLDARRLPRRGGGESKPFVVLHEWPARAIDSAINPPQCYEARERMANRLVFTFARAGPDVTRPAGSCRLAAGVHHLVGQPAGEFGHVVEASPCSSRRRPSPSAAR